MKLPYPKPICPPSGPHALTPDQAKNTLAAKFGPIADKLRQIATDMGIRPYRVFLTWTKWTGVERGQGVEVLIRRAEILPTPEVISIDNMNNVAMHAGVLPTGTLRIGKISTTYFSRDILMGKAFPGDAVTVHVPPPPGDCNPYPDLGGKKVLSGSMNGGMPPVGANDGMTIPGYPSPPNAMVGGAQAPQVFDGDALPFGEDPREKHIPEPIDFFYEVVEDGRHDQPPKRMRYRPYTEPALDAGGVQWKITLERSSEDRTRDDKSAIGTGLE
jgi:hypothetical protein